MARDLTLEAWRKEVRQVRHSLTLNLLAGAMNEGSWARNTQREFALERLIAHRAGKLRWLRLNCGHRRGVRIETMEEHDADASGVIECLADPQRRCHREYMAIEGWVERPPFA